MIIYESILTTRFWQSRDIFEAAGALVKIILSQKPNYHKQI